MKLLFIFFIFLLTLHAKTYVISGGINNSSQTIASKILKIAYTRAGLKINFKFMQLEKSLFSSNTALTDGEISRIKNINKIYKNLLIIPVPLVTVQAITFSKNSSLYIDKWSDLKAYNVTIVSGTKFIEQATKEHNITTNLVPKFKDAFKKLTTDNTEAIVVPKLVGLKYIYLTNSKQIHMVSKPLKTMKLYHFVNTKNKDLVPILTPILQRMKDSGEVRYWKNAYLRSLLPN